MLSLLERILESSPIGEVAGIPVMNIIDIDERSRVEAGPLVKGVPEAVHQSFPSEEEARTVFALAFSKGHTRIVGDCCNTNQHTSKTQTFSSGSTGSNSYSNGSFSTTSSTPSVKTLPTYLSPRQHRPQVNSAHESPNSKTSFKPDNNDKKPTEPVPVDIRVFQEDTRVSTPQSDPTGLSPSLKRPLRRPRAIVKTPSWLASYPKSPQPLSPLDGEYLSFNNFRTGVHNGNDQSINFKPSPLASSSSSSSLSMYCARTPRMSTISPQSNGSVSDSIICFSPPVRHVHIVRDQDKDPRSPMLSQAKVPASGLK
jgi:hypothetical protein